MKTTERGRLVYSNTVSSSVNVWLREREADTASDRETEREEEALKMSTRSSQRRLIVMFWPNYNMFFFSLSLSLSEIIFGKTGHRVAFNDSTTADVPFE